MSAILNTAGLDRPVRSHVDHAPVTCGCGQDLGHGAIDHCPRCGTQLGEARREAAGSARAA